MELKNGYKQTEIGIIPEDWDVKRLGILLLTTQLGGNYPNSEEESSFPLIKMGNLNRGFINVDKVLYIIKNITPNITHLLYDGDVLFNTRNTLELVGKVAIWRGELPNAYFNSNIMRFIFNPKYISSNFYMNLVLNKRGTILQLKGIATGTTSVAAIYTRDLINIQIPLPPKPEQESIATALSDTDNLISSLEKLIAKKKAIKQGAMQKLLTPKEGWEVKKLGEIGEFLKGIGLPKSCIKAEGEYACIHYGQLFTKYKETIKKIFSYTDTIENAFYSVSNDVLMPTSDVTPNGLARASCIKEDGVILGSDILVIRLPQNILDGIFLSYYILQNREKVMMMVTGSTVYHLYGSDMRKFEIEFPTITEQTKITITLTEMDSEIEAIETKLEKYKNIKLGMMQVLLTGKIRLL